MLKLTQRKQTECVINVVEKLISVLMMSLLSALRPPELTSAGIGDEMSPIALSVVFWLSLVLMSGCIFAIGRMMGGTGGFHDALLAMVWLQVVSVVLQVGQVILLLISPVLALLSGWVFIVFGMWLMVNFITVIHDFSSRMAVFMGMILSAVGLSFALRIILGILGVEIVNA